MADTLFDEYSVRPFSQSVMHSVGHAQRRYGWLAAGAPSTAGCCRPGADLAACPCHPFLSPQLSHFATLAGQKAGAGWKEVLVDPGDMLQARREELGRAAACTTGDGACCARAATHGRAAAAIALGASQTVPLLSRRRARARQRSWRRATVGWRRRATKAQTTTSGEWGSGLRVVPGWRAVHTRARCLLACLLLGRVQTFCVHPARPAGTAAPPSSSGRRAAAS